MTRGDFNGEMVRMLGLRFAPATMDTHWEGLQSIPVADLHRGVTRAILSRSEFPTPAELRADCDAERVIPHDDPSLGRGEVLLDAPIPLGVLPDGTVLPAATHAWTYCCETCSDTGWQSVWCGVGRSRSVWVTVSADCGRYVTHEPHEFSRKCACWDSNPVLVAARNRQRKYSQEPAETKRSYGRGRAA
jgi:hypothetical protein